MPELDATEVSDYNGTEHFVLPLLLEQQFKNKQNYQIVFDTLSLLQSKDLQAVIDATILLILSHQNKIKESIMAQLLPYIKLNQTFEFNPFFLQHHAIGLTPLMFTKNKSWIDFILSQKELDLSIKANPLIYLNDYQNYFISNPKCWEKELSQNYLQKIQGLNTFDYSVYTQQKHKIARIFNLSTPFEKNEIEKKKFDLILNEPNMFKKRQLIVEQMSAQNQHLLNNLDNEKLKNVLIHQNGKQGNVLFHAIKEGNLVFIEKLLTLSYFTPKDKSPSNQSYIMYCYNYNKHSIVSFLFDNHFYEENEKTLKDLARHYFDSQLYQKIFFKNPKKDDLGFSIKLGTINTLDFILKHQFYSYIELRQIFHDYSSFLLLNKTKLIQNDFTFIYSNRNSRRAYFHLMKYLVEQDKKYDYIHAFLEECQHSFNQSHERYKVQSYLDYEMALIFGDLVRYIPEAKNQALPFFISLNPTNPRFIKLEKKGLEQFLLQLEKEEDKKESKTQDTIIKKHKI